jgi:hypothetical protein
MQLYPNSKTAAKKRQFVAFRTDGVRADAGVGILILALGIAGENGTFPDN